MTGRNKIYQHIYLLLYTYWNGSKGMDNIFKLLETGRDTQGCKDGAIGWRMDGCMS